MATDKSFKRYRAGDNAFYCRQFGPYKVVVRCLKYPSDWRLEVYRLPFVKGPAGKEQFREIMDEPGKHKWHYQFRGNGKGDVQEFFWKHKQAIFDEADREFNETGNETPKQETEPVEETQEQEVTDAEYKVVVAEPEPEPEVEEDDEESDDVALQIAALLKNAGGGSVKKQLAQMRAEIDALKGRTPVFKTEIKKADGIVVETGEELRHRIFRKAVQILGAGLNAMVIGPTGSGKTALAKQIADALGVQFKFTGAILQKYELLGFVDATGTYRGTAFREVFENGGLFLWDEVDASNPAALVAFNTALANGHMDFPDGIVERHPDFYCIASGNTWGNGADREYVGRNQLDAATLNRFACLFMDYDTELEKGLAGDDDTGKLWCDQVQRWRRAARELKIRHPFSMRAITDGAALLRAGMDETAVAEAVVWKDLDRAQVDKIKSAA